MWKSIDEVQVLMIQSPPKGPTFKHCYIGAKLSMHELRGYISGPSLTAIYIKNKSNKNLEHITS
jgi:hypothetical protein